MKEEEPKDTPSLGTKSLETAFLRIVTRTQGVRIPVLGLKQDISPLAITVSAQDC